MVQQRALHFLLLGKRESRPQRFTRCCFLTTFPLSSFFFLGGRSWRRRNEGFCFSRFWLFGITSALGRVSGYLIGRGIFFSGHFYLFVVFFFYLSILFFSLIEQQRRRWRRQEKGRKKKRYSGNPLPFFYGRAPPTTAVTHAKRQFNRLCNKPSTTTVIGEKKNFFFSSSGCQFL